MVDDKPLHGVGLFAEHKWKYGADWLTWMKFYHLPMTFGEGAFAIQNAGNPVLQKSASGWDSMRVSVPSVVKYKRYYYMIYMGALVGGDEKIGIARSTDKINWTKSADNPIITNDVAWKNRRVMYASLVIDPVDAKFKIYYAGEDTGSVNHRLGYASCPLTSDPMVKANWTDYAGNPVYDLKTNGFTLVGGCLVLGRLRYLLLFNNTTYRLSVLLSDDDVNWSALGADIDTLGASGEWDDYSHFYTTIFWNQGIFYLVYAGQRSSTKYSLGLEVGSGDGTVYTKIFGNKGNPIFRHDAGANHTFAASLLMEAKSFWMWYTGAATYAIFLAKMNLDY